MMPADMNRLLRPFGLKLGPLQAGAMYFPLHLLAVGIGLTLLISPHDVAVFWPASGALFAFLLLYPPNYWLALALLGFTAEVLAHLLFAPQIPFPLYGLLYPIKFLAALLGVWLMHITVRNPISFARLRHVLCFAVAATLSTLACAFVSVSLRGGAQLSDPAFWLGVQNWWIGDLLGALIVTPLVLTVGFHGFAVTRVTNTRRTATLAAFLVLVCCGRVVPARHRRSPHPRCAYIVYPYCVDSHAGLAAAHGAGRRNAGCPGCAGYHACPAAVDSDQLHLSRAVRSPCCCCRR